MKKNSPRAKTLKPVKDAESSVLKAYVELCNEIGVVNITVQKIAERAGVAFGTVRYYFSSDKKQIHDEAFRFVLDSAYKTIDATFFKMRKKPDYDPIVTYVETMFSWIKESPAEASFLLYLYYLSSTQVTVNTPISQTVERARIGLQSFIHEAIGKGLYKPVNDSLDCAAKIHACVVGFGFIALSYKDLKSFNQQKVLCLAAVGSIIREATPNQ